MKIVATVRTLNEEKNIERFCQCYSWVDVILIADGGSTDKTLEKACKFDNVLIFGFNERKKLGGGKFYNPRGKHINSLLDRAERLGADVIIFDDCDCVPTLKLQSLARGYLESAHRNEGKVYAYRAFILGDDKWFPKMSKEPSLWAWSVKVPVYADEESYTISMKIGKAHTLKFHTFSLSLLHYFYPDEKTLQEKKSQYIQTGEVSKDYNPKKQFGRLENLPEWGKWK